MKGLKKIGILALSLSLFGVTACATNDNTSLANKTEETVDLAGEEIIIEETDTVMLNSMLLNVNNAKTTFYLGEEFSHEGLVVIKSLLVLDKDGNRKGFVQQETEDFTVNIDEVDMNTLGTYKVSVSVREQANIITQSYNINVKSSLFETTPNLEYFAGIEATYSDGKRMMDVLLNESSFNKDTIINGLKLTLHKKKTNANGTATTDLDPITITKNDVQIEENVDISKVGTYLIKVKYIGDNLTINGTTYTNEVSAFVIIDVINPITKIQFIGSASSRQFEATVNDIDFAEAGWKFRLTPTVGDQYVVDFSYDLFDVSDVDIFNWGTSQAVTVTYKEDPTVTVNVQIIINESTTQDITSYYTLTPEIKENNAEGLPTVITLAGTDFIYGPLPKAIDTDNYYGSGATYVSGRVEKDKYGAVGFDERISIKGTAQAFKVVLEKDADLVVFFAPTGDEESDISIYQAKGDELGDEIDTVTSGDIKQQIKKAVFTVPAGTYYIAAPGAGVYVHGFIVATAK